MAATFASHNFVGRDVTNTVIALAQNAYASEDFKITEELLEQVRESKNDNDINLTHDTGDCRAGAEEGARRALRPHASEEAAEDADPAR